MNGVAPLIATLLPETFRDPQSAARRIIALGLPMEARWLGLALVVVLAVIETQIALLLIPGSGQPEFLAVLSDPLVGVPAQALALFLVALVIDRIGAVFGGRGRFADALLLVVWIEFVMTLAQAAQLLAMLVLPPVGALLAIAVMIGFIWILAQFIAALHGFENLFKVILGMVVGFAIVVTILATLFASLGLMPPV